MTLVEAPPSDEIRVILCLKFDSRASFDEVAAFKRALIDCDYVLDSVEVSGGFDFILEAGLHDFAEYHAHLERFANPMAALVERHEANFICRRFLRVPDREEAIWVPCKDGRRRVDCASIDLVHAEGDYVRIHCGDRSWLLHDTMHHMREKLDRAHFLTLHRSTIANIGFIDRLIHRHHYWIAMLGNGTHQRIAKSQVAVVLAQLRTDSSNVGGHPTNGGRHPAEAVPAGQISVERVIETIEPTPSATAIP
jgi:hypothetical protein